jgi:hypothetical protein
MTVMETGGWAHGVLKDFLSLFEKTTQADKEEIEHNGFHS